jgi:hypothetical protein
LKSLADHGEANSDQARVWLELHESGTYVKLTQSSADLFG